MPSNTVEAVLKSRYEDGIDAGVEKTRALMERSFSMMKDASGAAGASIGAAFESAVGGLQSWRSKLSQAADDTDNSFKKMSLGALALGIGITEVFLRASKAAADFVLDLVKESSALFEARTAFDNLTKAAGVQGDVFARQLKEATRGQISGLTLLRDANKVLAADLPLTSEQYVKLTENVFRLAKSAGKDGVQAQEALTDALIRGQSRGLGPAIGLHIAMKDAVSAMAEATGSAIPDAGRLTVFYSELLTKTTDAVARLGKEHLTLEDVINQTDRTWKGVFSTIGVGILKSGVFQELLEKTSRSLLDMSISGEHQNEVALKTNAILISLLRDLADFLSVLGVIVTALNVVGGTVVFVINAALAVLATAILALTAIVYAFIETLAHIPGIGVAFRAAADSTKYAVDYMSALLNGFAQGAAHSFDGTKSGMFDMADRTRSLAAELERFRGETVKTEEGLGGLGKAAQKAASDQKTLLDQWQRYRELMFSLGQVVADAETKELQEFAHRNEEILKLDQIGANERHALYEASYAVLLKQRGDRERAEREQREKAAQEQLKSIRELDDQLFATSATGQEKAELQFRQHQEKINQITKEGTAERARLTTLALFAYLAEIDKLNAEEFRRAEELARKKEELRKKEISDVLATANLIARVDSERSKLQAGIVDTALARIPQTIDTIKKKLGELYAQKTFSDQQIDEIIKLKEALEKLNKINLTPFERMLQQLKDNMQQIGGQITKAWGQFWSDLISGQDGAGKKFIASLVNIIAQQLEIWALDQTAQAIVAAADGDWPGAAQHAAAAAGLGALGGILSGFASSLSASSTSGASSAGIGTSSGSTGTGSSTPTQVINVGAAGRSQAAVPQETKHVVQLEIKPSDAYVIRTVKQNVTNNGELRTVIKQNA